MIIGIAGRKGTGGTAGAGKDSVADFLVRDHRFARVAFADVMKRIAKELFQWPEDALWGPSELRNAPDITRRRPDGMHLTPRHFLQFLGTEVGRACYEDVWVDYCLRTAKAVLGGSLYKPEVGLTVDVGGTGSAKIGVAIPDVRFSNEARAIRVAGGKVWRVNRLGSAGLVGAAAAHASENSLKDSDVDLEIQNEGTLEDLRTIVRDLMTAASSSR